MEHSKRVLLLAMAALILGLASAHEGQYLTGHPLTKIRGPYRTGRPLRKTRPSTPPLYKPLALSVEGVVFCQNCSYVGTRSLTDALPLKGAKVQLACRDWRYKTYLYDTAITDENGYFFLKVPNFNFVKHNPIKTCRVFLVSSPSTNCNVRTNINSGKFGSFLRKEKDFLDQILYSVGPFAFAPRYPCKKTPPIYSPPIYTSPSPVYASPPLYSAPPPY